MTEQEIQDLMMKNGEELSKLSPDEVLDKMDFTDEEKSLIKDASLHPEKFEHIYNDPAGHMEELKRLSVLGSKYQDEIIKLLLGPELYAQMAAEESSCGGCCGCHSATPACNDGECE